MSSIPLGLDPSGDGKTESQTVGSFKHVRLLEAVIGYNFMSPLSVLIRRVGPIPPYCGTHKNTKGVRAKRKHREGQRIILVTN